MPTLKRTPPVQGEGFKLRLQLMPTLKRTPPVKRESNLDTTTPNTTLRRQPSCDVRPWIDDAHEIQNKKSETVSAFIELLKSKWGLTLFDNIPADVLDIMVSKIVYKRLRAGECLITNGERATDLFMIFNGETLLYTSKDLVKDEKPIITAVECEQLSNLVMDQVHRAGAWSRCIEQVHGAGA